jgi:cytochrome c peroxidase
VNKNIACSYCHDPAAGYANGVSILSVFTGGSSPGSVPITVHGAYPNNRIGKRNPQAYPYAAYYPPLHYNLSQADFYGGNFWDGRATGYKLQNSAANLEGQAISSEPTPKKIPISFSSRQNLRPESTQVTV